MLPPPNKSFQLLSLHDSLQLQCRVYFPSRQTQLNTLKVAIIAHPYAPLGGCYDDPVVGLLGRTMLKQAYIVVTFNFR